MTATHIAHEKIVIGSDIADVAERMAKALMPVAALANQFPPHGMAPNTDVALHFDAQVIFDAWNAVAPLLGHPERNPTLPMIEKKKRKARK